MSLKAGIVGLPNVGKSTLFNAITKKNILAANYPFATIEPNIGVVIVPDKRLEFLNNLYQPNKLIPTTFEFIDIAGLVSGASKGDGLGNKFLNHIREVDAIVEVVRCFEDTNIIHVENEINPIKDIEIIKVELILADLEVVDKRLGIITKKAHMIKDLDILREIELLEKTKENLLKNYPIRVMELTKEEFNILKPFNFLTLKPIIYMANVDEEGLIKDNKYVEQVKGYASSDSARVIKVCAKIEAELSDLETQEKKEFLSSLGIEESGLDKLIRASYSLLGLATFFTTGKDEVRAWTFKKGMKAPTCAGFIHTDFEKGFIKAEVMSYDVLEKHGSELAVKEAGKMRLEGKDYIMSDGDICYFRFNV